MDLVLRKLVATALAVAVVGAAAGVAYASNDHGDLARLKQATAKYHRVSVAEAAQYGKFVDVNGIACIDMPGMGAMGIHYVNGGLVGDGEINPLTPEAVIYEPGEHGSLHLVAVEYVVLKAAWDANHSSPPTLFGQQFNFTAAGNRFGLPDFYSLHVWVWKHNPAGTFAMWNPNVHCNSGDGHEMDDDQMANM